MLFWERELCVVLEKNSEALGCDKRQECTSIKSFHKSYRRQYKNKLSSKFLMEPLQPRGINFFPRALASNHIQHTSLARLLWLLLRLPEYGIALSMSHIRFFCAFSQSLSGNYHTFSVQPIVVARELSWAVIEAFWHPTLP